MIDGGGTGCEGASTLSACTYVRRDVCALCICRPWLSVKDRDHLLAGHPAIFLLVVFGLDST